MADQRWDELADILVNYSTGTRRGDRVLVTMMEVETLDLARAVCAQAIRAGALPHVEFQSAYLERDLMVLGAPDQLSWVPEMQMMGMEWADVYIGLRGARNPHEFDNVPVERIAVHKKAIGGVSARRTERTRWVLVRVPNESLAQQAHTSLDEMTSFFFGATLRDWKSESRRYAEIRDRFQRAEAVRLVGRDTDVRFSTRGRTYEVADGHLNMPDGEVFTSPVDDSVNGTISFEFPGVYMGRRVGGIRLTFTDGVVSEASATSNQDLLHELLAMDEGSRRVGEFGVGINFGIDRFCYDILYDEKIGGTVHLALGRAYAECGGVNQSALHWDLIKDLRSEGAILLDGEKVFEDGRFLF